MGHNVLAIVVLFIYSVTIISALQIRQNNIVRPDRREFQNGQIGLQQFHNATKKTESFHNENHISYLHRLEEYQNANEEEEEEENENLIEKLQHSQLTNDTEVGGIKNSTGHQGPSVNIVELTMVRHIPFAFYESTRSSGTSSEEPEKCIPNSSKDFPNDIFTMEEKRHGAVILHFILGIYCFTLLAVVCNDYFLPSVEHICQALNLSEDVAAATFMAIATSAPEFFVNVVGTFVTKSDIGVGTVAGSAMFNTLGVAALGGLAASKPIQIHWWPLTRDSVIYVFVVTMLVLICHDGQVEWYEAMILLICYIVYFFIMWANGHLYTKVKKILRSFTRNKCKNIANDQGSTSTTDSVAPVVTPAGPAVISSVEIEEPKITINISSEKIEEKSICNQIFSMPEGSVLKKLWFLYSWPIRLLLACTIPDCKKYPKIFPITFIMCVVVIGTNSYIVSWMITVIGNTVGVPDFVMGLTLLAAGGCLPEAISIVIVSRKGQGGMGVSNSLGANTLDILLCLGLPWFVKVMLNYSLNNTNQPTAIDLGTGSLFYTIIALIVAVLVLYSTLCLSGYMLNRKVGFILIVIYAGFLTAAIVMEMYYLKSANIKTCEFIE